MISLFLNNNNNTLQKVCLFKNRYTLIASKYLYIMTIKNVAPDLPSNLTILTV